MGVFRKHRAGAPEGFFAAEAAGLTWLAEPGAVPVVEVLGHDATELRLVRLESARPTPEAAREFGRRLADLHDSGVPGFGWAPHEPAYFGPLDAPMEVPTTARESFADYWAHDRLTPMLARAAAEMRPEEVRTVEEAIAAVASGARDGIAGGPAEEPARVHGDLWSGNAMWTPDGVTLIDPAAHGGHRLEDLAMLDLFGFPHLAEVRAGYAEVHPLPAGWEADVPAHQLFGLLAHVALFGSSYTGATLAAARTLL